MDSTLKKQMGKKRCMRPNNDLDSHSDDEKRQTTSDAGVTSAWPKYLVLEPLNETKPLSVLSVFAIDTATRGISSSLEV